MKRSGFTLIEILVVIAIIGILAGLLFSGIFGLLNQSANAKNQDNAALLSAAIMEYWHDQGRWPIPKNHKPKKVNRQTHHQTDYEGNQIEGQDYETYQYKLVYGAIDKNGKLATKGYNNDEIVKILLDAKVGKLQSPKRYIDLGPFITVEDGTDPDSPEGGYPVEEVRSSRGLEDDVISGKVRAPLLFQASFIRCPKCGKLYPAGGGRRTCDNKDCSYYQSQGKYYRFKASELKGNVKGAKPYVITFDFLNNKCNVTMP